VRNYVLFIIFNKHKLIQILQTMLQCPEQHGALTKKKKKGKLQALTKKE
jgi:hypothetical protein